MLGGSIMNVFLTLACLFFIGSVTGWVIELLFRNIVHHNKKWVNPGFCTGPYLPIYGFGLCTLYLLANLEQYGWITNPVWNKIVLFIAMAIGMTLIEYIAGLFCLKYFKVMLWDYSNLWGNIQGLVCPLFSFCLNFPVYYSTNLNCFLTVFEQNMNRKKKKNVVDGGYFP